MTCSEMAEGESRMLWESDTVRLKVLCRPEAVDLFDHNPHLRGMWDRHAPFGALGRRFLRGRADGSVVRWGLDPALTGSVYVLDRYDRESGGYLAVGISGWWHDPACWPETVKFRWQAVSAALGAGLGSSLVRLSAQAIRLECPQARYVSESCPVWSRALIRYYRRLGFQRWADPDRRGVGIPLVPTVSLRLPLSSLPSNSWGQRDESSVRLRNLSRPRGDLRFVFEPDPRYGI